MTFKGLFPTVGRFSDHVYMVLKVDSAGHCFESRGPRSGAESLVSHFWD